MMSLVSLLRSPGHIILLVFILLNSCSPKLTPYSGEKSFQSPTGKPDYSNLDYWAAHPGKWDPADSIPEPLRPNTGKKDADVFFLHPTTYTDQDTSDQPNAKIDDPLLNKKTDYKPILYQASVFNEVGLIYAPRYRQANIQMYFTKDTAKALAAFDLAYEDIKTAFIYYLENYNKGRPIIIASHSQGTTHAKRLLKEFFDGKPLSRQLVAAYILGIPVEKNYFSAIRICNDSLSTGCFVSWRTYRNGYQSEYISRADTSIAVVNPLLWSLDPTLASRNLQKGAVLYNFNKVYKHTQSSQATGNALWVSKPKFPGGIFYFTKNYHAGDFNLFYIDIREDVKRRVQIFLDQRQMEK